MSRRRRIVIVTAALAAAAAVWWSSSYWHGARVAPRRAGLAVGEQRAYELVWDGTSVADASGLPSAADTYTGEVHVRGRLVMRGLGRDGDAELVGYRIENVSTASYQVMGQDILAGVDATAGELVAAIGPDGRIRDLRPDPEASPAADLLLRAIAQQSAVTIAATDQWSAVEPGPTGVARMSYRRGKAGLVRTRDGYERLAALPGACATCVVEVDGTATIGLDRRGVLRDLSDREQLVVMDQATRRLTVDNRFTLHASARPAIVRRAPRLAKRRVIAATGADLGDDPDVEEDRAEGWSLDRIGSTVVRFVATGATPSEPMWMRGVAAYLRVHPEACQELLRMFSAPGLPPAGRDLIASMLVAAGTPAAQSALRDGVDWMEHANHTDQEVASAMSRIALVERPTEATVAWLASQRADRDQHPASASAATLALGAAIGQIDDAALSERHAAALRDELATAGEAAARVELLSALGNAGRDADGAAIGALAADPDPAVRTKVSLALRKLDDGIAVAPLTSLAADTDGIVRAGAIEMLSRRTLDATAADRAVQASLAAGARSDELGPLVRLLLPHRSDPAVAATLRSLLDRVAEPALRAQIHHALAS